VEASSATGPSWAVLGHNPGTQWESALQRSPHGWTDWATRRSRLAGGATAGAGVGD
jgi:hypothetical protein